VEVHQRPGITTIILSGVDEEPCKLAAVNDVIAAATPVEVSALLVPLFTLVSFITGTAVKRPLATRSGDGVDEPGGHYSMYSSRLTTACNQNTINMLTINNTQHN